jgi:hypothetical protein
MAGKKRRAKPMKPMLQELGEAAIARMWTRPATPDIGVAECDGGWTFHSPYQPEHAEQWEALLLDAFATRSAATFEMFTSQLSRLCSQSWDDKAGVWLPNERELVAAIQIVRSMAPRNEAEAALAAQAVAVHFATMKLGEHLRSYADPRTVAIMAKAARTYASQVETMDRLKGRKVARQKITVRHEKHIHQHQHVHFERGGSDYGGRPDGTDIAGTGRTAEELAGCAALPGPAQASAGAVPLACGEGQAGLPAPRRGARRRRAEGQG